LPSLFKTVGAVVCLVFALCFAAPNAHADTFTPFTVSGVATNVTQGSLGSCAHDQECAFSGTMTIDVTSGAATLIDLTFPGLTDFTNINNQLSGANLYFIVATSPATALNLLGFNIVTSPTIGSLADFTNGTIVGGNVRIGPPPSPYLYLISSGTITPAAVATPEPSSLALMLSGVGLVFAMRKRSSGLQLAS
jgi:PEP-CTERM motif-containing protein